MADHAPGTADDDPDSPVLLPGAVDARFTLAAERTMLAWLRTAMGLIAAGVAVLYLLDPLTSGVVRSVTGSALVVAGALAAVIGVARWRRVTHALVTGRALPGPAPIIALAAVIVLIAIGLVAWQ